MSNVLLDSFIVAVLQVVFPAALAAAATWFVASVTRIFAEIKATRPDLSEQIDTAVKYAVMVVEQMKKNGTIPDNATAKKYAEDAAIRYLTSIGVKNAEKYVELISDGIEYAVYLLH